VIQFIKIIKVINRKILIYFYPIVFLGLVAAFLDTISIGMIFPLMNSLLDNKTLFSGSSLDPLFNFNLSRDLIISLFFILFFFKNLLLIFYNYISSKFSEKIYNEISKKILKKKIEDDYLIFKTKTSAEFLRDLKDFPNNIKSYFDCFLSISIEITTFIFIVFFLLIIDFYKTIILIIFFIFIFLTYEFFIKDLPGKWGSNRTVVLEKLNNSILQIYNSYIDIKIFNKDFFFLEIYNKFNRIFSNLTTRINFLSSINRNIIEIAILTCIGFGYFFFKNSIDLEKIVPLVTLYGLSFLRLLPSINKILSLRNTLKSYSSVIAIVKNIINTSTNQQVDTKEFINFSNRIEFEKVSYKYPGSSDYIIKDRSFTINKNYFFGIRGSSGKGKSTLCKMLLSLIIVDSGKILIDGNKIEDISKSFRKKIAYVSQNFYILNDTLYRNITLAEKKDKASQELFHEVLRLSLSTNFINELGYSEDTIINEDANNLSGGQRQRLCIARALFKKPQILVLDEATNSLDKQTELEIINNLKNLEDKITVIIISHNQQTLSYCDEILDLNN
jgi:ABC-type multidrug transport system fused ATPase/permease subunit